MFSYCMYYLDYSDFILDNYLVYPSRKLSYYHTQQEIDITRYYFESKKCDVKFYALYES